MENIQLKDLVETKNIVTVNETQTTEEVLDILNKNRISSVPVKSCTKYLVDPGSSDESLLLTTDDLLMLQKRTKDFKVHQVMDLPNMSQRSTFVAYHEDTPLSKAVDHFKNGVHRIAITNKQGKLTGVFSQIDFIDWVLKNPNKIPGFKGDYELQSAMKGAEVLTAPLLITAADGFMLMHKKGLSSLAVIGTLGEMTGVLSASDIKFATGKDFRILLSKIQEYINMVHAANGKPLDYLMAVKPNAKLIDVLQIVSKERIHRVFMCDKDGKPLQAISLTDLVREIVKPVTTEAH